MHSSHLRPIQRFAVTIAFLFAATATQAADWTVCPAGCDSNSLQGAVQSAAATGDTITLLTSGPHLESNITLAKSLIIRGPEGVGSTVGAAATRHTAISRLFTILPGNTVELRDLTLRYGNDVDGGAIFNSGNLLLTRTILVENDASNGGGALYNAEGASAVIRDSRLQDNASGGGGAISNEGYLRVEDSSFLINNSSNYGGAIRSRSGSLWLERSLLRSNDASFSGGAIAASGGSVVIRDSELFSNRATLGGGLSLNNSVSAVLERTTLVLNTARYGGGAYVRSSVLTTFVNSTLSSNRAKANGGAVYLYGEKHLDLSSVSMTSNTANSDFTDGGTGGGIFMGTECGGSFCILPTVTLRNTLLGDNKRNNNGTGFVLQDCVGDLTSAGYNLVATGSTSSIAECEVEGDLTGTLLGVDPGLDTLGQHGGVVLLDGTVAYTQSLLSTSLALNHGHPGGCRDRNSVLLSTDQRYAARVGSCDIGAFEFNGVPTPPISLFSDGFESGNTSFWAP